MHNKTVFVVLLLLTTLQAQQFIQLGSNLRLRSLSEMHEMDPNQLECSPSLGEVSESMEAWSEILENQDQLTTDSNNLQQLSVALQDFRGQGYEDVAPVLLQYRNSFSDILNQISAHHLQITPYQRWRKESALQLQGVVSLLDKADNEKDLDDCCDRIEQLIERLMKEREEVRKQCKSGPQVFVFQTQITINIINSKADQVREISQECTDNQGTVIRIKPEKDGQQQVIPDVKPDIVGPDGKQPVQPVQPVQPPKPKPTDRVPEGDDQQEVSVSEPSSTTDEEDDDTSSNKKITADFTTPDPVFAKDVEAQEPFQEYGYGYWAKFLLAYPKLMPNGKDAPWYFVSRLSANKKDENINMGDRLLAVWLGKGYYHFTTCDQPKNQPNVAQNVNYPEDLDGVWTYIYYSYSVEKKKAVAFIKFGNDDVKQVTHEVQNPSTKWVRFTVGGKDQDRYPGFNGLIQQVYISTKLGVFIDSQDDLIGRLQAQKKQPKDFLPELLTYKVVNNPLTRDPETKEVLSIVGTTKNPKFPHEYAFSGWFKWEEPKQQQEWHNVFRVQVQQPSTDKFLGDRTLSAWIGKSEGGILHLPTYSFTNLEGAGNANVIKNIPHKDRHKEWFFVYFGYSRPQKKAIAQVQWKNTQDKQEYENIKHFQVPKYFVYVGKDKHFPGFSGKVALVAFNVGEGAFKPNNDFGGKGDPFNFATGKKKLIGVQPEIDTEEDPDKQKKPYKVIDDADTDSITRPSSSEENKPVLEEAQENENDLVEYGYGFWLRFLTAHPDRLLNGKNAPWYFVSRLTSNPNYKNIEMGDRLLAIWQGQGYYHFTTCDQPKNQPNVIQNINYPNDIEGMWTYVYYSYSAVAKKAIAFIQYADQEPRTILHSVQHPAAKKVKFILGGMDNKQYPGFNGLFSQVTFSTKLGVFLDTVEDFSDQLKRTIIPKQDLDQFYNHELISDVVTRKPTDIPDYDEIGGGQEMFPHEYAISGWFKWEQTQQQVWHNVFRVQIKKPSTDRFLGDRTLSAWIGTAQGGILHFPTYTYTNMNGAGNPNMVSNIQHKNRIFDWFFVYFGYSKNQQKAFVGVRFASGIETLEYNNVNHYYAPKFYTFVGKDMHFPGLNGKLGYVNFNLGDGTFRKVPDFKHPNDIFGLQKGEANILKKPDTKKVQPVVDKETGEKQIPNAVNDNAPKVTQEYKSEAPLQEYGYGFWMRFLTAYPTKLPNGKNAPWYFVSRLANKANYDNVGMGDRTLAIWQGQGFYHFTTCSVPGQVNVNKNINYPADIEGLWTYVYYSYSKQEKKAVAFIQYGATDPIDLTHQVTHPDNTYVKFVLGGKDQNRYPAFNGQFQSVVHSASPGAYIGTMDGFKAFLAKQPNPLASKVVLNTTPLVESQIQRQPETPAVTQTVEVPFPKEYAISGWFKWEQPANQQVWHNIFRVQISQPSLDRDLGDRTLAAWVGTGAGGIIHLTTYTYKNMNGAGSNNLPQNINHKNRHNEWFFVYLGYSKNDKQAYAYIKWRDSEDNLEFKDINHYFANKYFVFLGKDVQFPGFSGRIANTAFNAGEGSFKKGNDFKHPTDAFKFDKGSQLVPKGEPTKPVVDDKSEHASKFNNNAPNVDKTLTSNDVLVEYGYGFWARFLTAYPARLIQGKNQPWYFVSRLTTNVQYDNVRMGDRALAIWQGQGFYHFTTCNQQNGAVNVIQNIVYPNDIEGVWTYIYYSYSAPQKKAVAFIKYGNDEVKTITHQVVHPETRQVRFILGGMDNNRYPAFNGVFTKVSYSHEKGAFIDSLDAVKPRIGIVPDVDTPLANMKLVADQIERAPTVAHISETAGDEQTKLPQEYAISGWFKWDQLQGQQVWHNIFRVSINSPFSDRFMGDRTLAVWLGTEAGGILHHTTYSYTTMNGDGNPNIIQNVNHKNRHQEWFFLYYGYSKKEQKGYAFLKFKDSEETLTFAKINHYLAPKFFLYLGKDPNFPGWNGKLGYVNFNIGKGSFKTGNDFTDDADKFGFTQGAKAITKPVEPIKPEAQPEADKQVHASKTSEDAPKVDKQTVAGDQNLVEYGYGYWLRFLTVYPERLPNGKNQPWYFVSRLATNIQYDNIRMGDRALAIWQGQGFYHFTTCDQKSNNANVIKNVDHPADIEGVWTYIYYSYSTKENNAIAFIKFGDGDFTQVTHQVTHPIAKQVRFILGGTDDKRYPAFNGLFTNVYFNNKVGAYLNSVPSVNKLLDSQGPKPSFKLVDLATTTLIDKETSRDPKKDPQVNEVEDKRLPHQYAFSGWFRWGAIPQEAWHNIFRVQIKTPSTDNVLGDRTLSAWVGTSEGGIYHFPTYTYTNMVGGGNSNYWKNIAHKGRHTEWHFVYFGYSKEQNKAQVYVKWTQSEDTLEYPDARHYFAPKFYIFTGRDNHFPGFNGNIAQAKFNIGEGAFVGDKNFGLPKDPFGFQTGVDTYHKDAPKPKPEVKPDTKVLDSATSTKDPVANREFKDEKELQSYGYGFWMRYLTVYPERLLQGKNQAWYFVSRLTWNEKYDNIAMGDRTLAIWQGQGFYHFTTCNIVTGNTNMIQNIDYPADIEGLWTFVYYSYNRADKQAVAFIQYGNTEPKTITHSTQHKDTKYVRFVLGGTDDARYPGFNGQFTSVSFDQNYIKTVDDFKQFVTKIGVPAVGLQQLTTVGLVDQVSRSAENDPSKEATVGGGDQKFPQEYAISGWFKWKPTAQGPWHNLFRVQIKKPSTDNFLGDRTLTLWVGTPEGGILHFPTYTYENMVGGGNANYYKNIVHKNRHTEWFFVYYGYSKTQAKAQVFVKWAQSEDSLTYENARHFLTPEFYVFVGRDKQFPGHSGKIGYVKFNLGDGAFLKDPNFVHPQDAFGYKQGLDTLVNKPEAKIEPGSVVSDQLSNGFEQKNPVVDKAAPAERELEEYGYGFWFRFLHNYPVRLPNGKNAPWYFMARLANQEKYDNIRMGDRTLAIWQGQGFYHFTTCNKVDNNPNYIKNINYPEDIEGLWTYVYYSYSDDKNRAVGHIKFGNDDIQSIRHDVNHPETKYVRFILGGNDDGRYPGFNGVFTQVTLGTKEGTFIDTADQLKGFISKLAKPAQGFSDLANYQILQDSLTRVSEDKPINKVIGKETERFPAEYAISGWFKWQPMAQAPWHNMFRVQIKTPSTDSVLGDRTFAAWVGTQEGGIIHLPTYSYANMVGGGNVNIWKNIPHKNRYTSWFFVYFGYSKDQQLAVSYIKWTDGEDQLSYEKVNHYLATQFYVFFGRDEHFPGFNGKVGEANFNLGKGAFRKPSDYTHPKDIFGFQSGTDKFVKKPADEFKPADADKTVFENAAGQDKPVVDKEVSSDKPYEQYGYGFWLRFLSKYPEPQPNGKNQAWYFVSRLTSQNPYDNIRMGDRTLAIWQGQGFYHFTTCNQATNNVNMIQNNNFPDDIEGLWTYIYYSYNAEQNKAVGFIKYGSQDFQRIVHETTHPLTKYLRFILGGNDAKRYPGFNGLFTSVTFSTDNAYVSDVDKLNVYLVKNQAPSVVVPLQTSELVKDQVTRDKDEKPTAVQSIGANNRFPLEYAISGWYRWKPTAQGPWHNVFRVQIKKAPVTDAVLGDRTLTCWIGTPEGGILHFPTYTYSNMNGAGNTNFYKNIVHKNRINEWFYVYYGYSKVQATTQIYVKWSDSEDTLSYDKIYHYLVPEFQVWVGRDESFPGINGRLAYVNFNAGDGAYVKNNKFDHPQDIFKFNAGQQKLFDTQTEVKPGQVNKDVLDSPSTKEKPVLDQNVKADNNLEEYGYGFWMRFLSAYPDRLFSGKNEAWYFVARLANQEAYDNVRMGDRMLAIWQGQGFYHFTTCNAVNNNVNVIQNIDYPVDIEGLWTYVYYSYSEAKSRAVGFIKYGADGEVKSIRHDVTHPDTKYVRFTLGGTDAKRYPAFNGIFTQVTFDAVKGVFIDTLDQLKSVINKLDNPTVGQVDLATYKLVVDEQYREKTNDPLFQAIGKDTEKFPLEYAISGWFKWQPAPQDVWQNIFRVSLNVKPSDQFLGDRTFAAWIGTQEGGIIHLPTYTYANMNGGGNTNVWKNIAHKDRHTKWFFVYFGYSKQQTKAYSYIKWQSDDDFLNYDNINHYYAPNFQVFVGRDKFFPGWNGKLAYVNFNVGKGAFRNAKDFTHPNDAFGIGAGVDKLKKPNVGFTPADADPNPKENAFNQDKPIYDKAATSENPFDEYGYGFWLRFLTVHPVRLPNGKNEAWYFVARLANQEKYDNIRMGDRMLAIWQGQGFYHFTAANAVTNNPNMIQNVNFPDDIEGLWTYVYYSYSAEEGKAQGFIKFGDDAFKQITHATNQPLTKYLRFLLGGNDDKRYPGFNGLFTQITFSTKFGAYVDNMDALNTYVGKNTYPKLDTTPQNYLLIKDPITRKPEDDFFTRDFGEEKQRFQLEYSVSGWYKWVEGTPANQWQNLYRVLLKKEPTDTAIMGDRTLAGWIGFGNVHQSTYTYTNMNGAGNVNLWKQAEHKDRHLRWFFLYHGYSRIDRLSYAYVKYYSGAETQSWDKVNHYFAPKFFVYVGKDALNGFNGQIGAMNFNLGAGSFRKGDDFTHAQDFFGFGAPFVQSKTKPFDASKDRDQNLLVSAAGQEKPTVQKVLPSEEVEATEEYGYGFWLRYLMQYPVPQRGGFQGEWNFVARLSKNQKWGDIGLGDRTLAIFMNRNNYYHFTTYSAANPNTIQNIPVKPDFEGVWTYIHFSHALDKKQSVAFLKFGDEKPVKLVFNAQHVPPTFLQFFLGGKDAYQSYNGQFSDVMVSASKGIYIEDEALFNKHLAAIKQPAQYNYDLKTIEVIPKDQKYIDKAEVKEITLDDGTALVPEYAWSGWFKWDTTPTAVAWYLAVRLSIYQNPENLQALGDRTLAHWIGVVEGGVMQFSTYNYANMVGGGNVDSWSRIKYGNDLVRWYYVYFGYSLVEKAAYYRVEFKGRTEEFTFKDHKHFNANKFSLQLGKDRFSLNFVGLISYFRFNAGDGAYKTSGHDKVKNDYFGYNIGKKDYVKPSPRFDVNKDQQKTVIDSPQSEKEPIYTKKLIGSDLDDINEYGFGFWLRFLSHYPIQLKSGLTGVPWSFVARLTKNQQLADNGVGDRVLAVWLNNGNFYHFTSYSGANPNLIQNIQNPADIEGVWYYMHYAHSLSSKQSIGFLHNGEKLQRIVHQAEHVPPQFLQFYLGGMNMNYPAFNGQFANVIFSVGDGIFKKEEAELTEFMKELKKPDQFNTKLTTKNVIDASKYFDKDTVLNEQVITDYALVGEYAWSGWFKWTPTVQQAWHLMVRLSILQASEDASFLGDRTLNAWVGQGYFHFTCYSYANIVGGGNVNQWQNMPYETDYTKWHFIYFGYSKVKRLAHSKVEFKDRQAELKYENTQQYLPNKFSLYLAKDKSYASYSGNIAYFRLNGGEGAFDPKTYNENPSDIFGYKLGADNVKEKEPDVDPLRAQEVLDSAFNQDKPVYQQDFKKADLEGITEYGYGFYFRHLEQYPVQMRDGRPEPWYMMSRLSWNTDEGNIRMGDRLLATWQEQAAILFVTNNLPGDPNLLGRIPVAEREGVWTFLYFSYSLEDQLAVGILKFDGNDEVFHLPLKCNHGKVNYLKFTLGSAPPHFYPRFNGQFANFAVKLGPSAFVKNYESKKKYLLNRIPHPPEDDKKLKQYKVTDPEKIYKGDNQDEIIEEIPIEMSKFATEYSISGWLRWDNPVIGQPWYNVFRLSLYPAAVMDSNRFGDCDIDLFKHTPFYRLHTYNYAPGGPWTVAWDIPHEDQHFLWHYFYIGYSREKQIKYIYFSFQESDFEKINDKQKHLVVNKHYLSFGKDYKKLYSSYRGFTGTAGLVTLNYGEGAFTMKPFTKKNDQFFFLDGEKKYRKPIDLVEIATEKDKPIASQSEQEEPVVDVQLEDPKVGIKGLDEYSWNAWTRWSRSEPNLPERKNFHMIARLSTTRKNTNNANLGDRTLLCQLIHPTYNFATYTQGNANVEQSTPQGIIDGQWNFVAMSYKKGTAKAYVVFNEKEVIELKFNVKHEVVGDYLRFQSGGNKNLQIFNFNGHLLNVAFRYGVGSHIATKEEVITKLSGVWKLPDSVRIDQARIQSVPLQKEKKEIKFDAEQVIVTIKPEVLRGKDQYSISGWARWIDPAKVEPWHRLYRVQPYSKEDKYTAFGKPADRTFGLWKGQGTFYFTTYTNDQGNAVVANIERTIPYDETMHKNWVFFYQGYSRQKQQVHIYVKFPTKEVHVDVPANHFVPNQLFVEFGKDQTYAGWNGLMEAWYFNTGDGAFRITDYDVGEVPEFTFGLGGRTIVKPENWEHAEMFQNNWGPTDQSLGKDVEITDDYINGVTEYSYGMWTRFIWNGEKKLVDKPAWMALSRLTYRPNYQGDNAQVGDRLLAIWIGAGFYHFTTINVVNNVNYNNLLDGYWNYIYFGYKKFEKTGKVVGHVMFGGNAGRSTNFADITHLPLQDYLYFCVGSSGAKMLKNYHSFNGHISNVILQLGDGAYMEKPDDVKKIIPEMQKMPELKPIKEVILEQAKDLKREEAAVAPIEFPDQFAGQIEYSVSIWFKWSVLPRVTWENVYTLSYNEPNVRGNHVRPGDRVLSLFQYADHKQYFSTYTNPDVNDAFQQIYTECQTPVLDQTAWVYAYYAYSRTAGNVYNFYKTRTTECEKKLAAQHRVPRYLGLYLGKDGIHTPYNGKYQQVYLMAGEGAYRDKDVLSFDPYIAGALNAQSKPYKWADKKDLFEQPFDGNVVVELDSTAVDGHSAYAIGFWSRYLTAIPKRVLDKPAWVSVARFTVNKDHQDMARVGDRTLALWLGKGFYGFRTYNLANNSPTLAQDIKYDDKLEGAWNFIYFCFASSKQQAIGYVKFGDTGEVRRVTFPEITHKPVEAYGKLIIGKEFSYPGFNGKIAQLQMLFGGQGYVPDVESLEALLKTTFPQPEISNPDPVVLKIQEDEVAKKNDDKPQITEWAEDYKESLEYSIFGWFRYSSPKLVKDNNVFLRLTNNEAAYRKEASIVGDRTLLIMYQPNEVVFSTYTLGTVDDGQVANIRKPAPLGNNFGVWTYVWFGYSWPRRVASGIAKFPSGTAVVPYDNVLHMVPKYMALFAGSDGLLGGWEGPMRKVGAIFGKGAYIDPSKGNFESLLPNLLGLQSKKSDWKPEKEEIIVVPIKDKPAFDLTFKEEVGGVTEYGYGLWTRWLMTTPDRVIEKAPFHQLIRLTNTEKYEDNVSLGNRVLAIWTGKGYYHFTTYDKKTNKASISANTNYDDFMEGNWNYIYYSFTAQDQPRAVGFVHFGELSGQTVARVELLDIAHNPLNGFARVVVANNEFGYPAFNGMIQGLRVFFGQGFVGSKEQFLKDVLAVQPKPQLIVPARTDINIIKDELAVNKGDDKIPLKSTYDQYQGVLEYAVSGWVQTKKGQVDELTRMIFRLTINDPSFQKDKAVAGDRTLSCFLLKDSFTFSTYDYGSLDNNAENQNDIQWPSKIGTNGGEWVFLYFAYNSKVKKAYAYTLYVNREEGNQYNDLKHYVPNKFWFYLGGDSFNQQFEGTMFNWNLNFGDGAFTNKPKTAISSWPYEPTQQVPSDRPLSVLLGNQGLSSIKLLRSQGALSGQFEAGTGPMSGQVDQASGPQSGQVDQASGPQSGKVDQASGPQSGKVDQASGPQSGTTEKGAGPASGQTEKGPGAASGVSEQK